MGQELVAIKKCNQHWRPKYVGVMNSVNTPVDNFPGNKYAITIRSF